MKPQWLIVPAAFLLLAGCGDSKYPLSDPQTSKADNGLLGVWKLQEENGRITNYHVGPAGEKFPDSMMRVAFVQHEKGKPESSGEFLLFATALGGKTYLNVFEEQCKPGKLSENNSWNAKAADSYLIFRYQVDGDKLAVWLIDRKIKEEAIKHGKIKGQTEKGKSVQFIDTTENVARFVIESGDSLFFDKPILLERVASGVRQTEQLSQREVHVDAFQSFLDSVTVPTPPLRSLGSNLMVDKNGIIWDSGKPVGIWGINGSEMRSGKGAFGR